MAKNHKMEAQMRQIIRIKTKQPMIELIYLVKRISKKKKST